MLRGWLLLTIPDRSWVSILYDVDIFCNEFFSAADEQSLLDLQSNLETFFRELSDLNQAVPNHLADESQTC